MSVVEGRAEEQETDRFGVALAKALAKPPVAVEWCLPLVRPGGAAILWLGPERRPGSSRARGRAAGRRGSGARGGAGGRAQGVADPERLPPAPRHGPETSSRLITMAVWGRIYAVANQKGGVGKTTTAINLAACLAEAGERVLLVDLDPQANATSGLGERANGFSSCDLLDGAPPGELARPTRFANLDLIPSKPDLAGTAAELGRRDGADRYLAETLAPAADSYGFVFVDCPPSLGPLTVNALVAAQRVLVPVQAEYYALEGLSQLLHSLSLIRSRLNPELVDRRVAADDGRREDAARGGRCRRARAALRALALQGACPTVSAGCRSPEPRPAPDLLRPALARRRGLLEGGDGACRASLNRTAAVSAAGSRC